MFVGAATGEAASLSESVVGLGVCALVVLTFAAAICASSGGNSNGDGGGARRTKSQDDRVRRSIKERDRLNTADTVEMASNELYTLRQNQRTTKMPLREAVEEQPSNMDEDEMANVKMEGTLARHRAMSAGQSGAAAAAAPRNRAETSGPRMRLGSDSPPWLHNNLKKRDAIDLLLNYQRETTEGALFLVRLKHASKGQFALDTLAPGRTGQQAVESFLINRAPTGQMEMDGVLLKSGARTVEAVISELYAHNQFCLPLSEFVPAPDEEPPTASPGSHLSDASDNPRREPSQEEELEI